MTDFAPESAWAESHLPSEDFWESTQPAPFPSTASGSERRQRRPAAALAADVNELLASMARKRVPRLDGVRQRLEAARADLDTAGMENALQELHAATTALDFLAGRSGGDKAQEFLGQGETLNHAAGALQARSVEFLARQALEGSVARLLWIDLVLESDSLHKRVRQGARWVAEMDQDLIARRKASVSDVMSRAIEELARKAHAMHERLQTVHRLCVQARAVHKQCEQLAEQSAALCVTLQEKVLPGSTRLQALLQPLLHAAAYRALVPTELIEAIDARHELQVVLTHAVAQVLRVREGDRELAAQIAGMEEKAKRIA